MLRKLNLVALLFLALLITNCSNVKDTSKFNAEEYYNYLMTLYNDEDYEVAVQEFQNFLLQYSGSAFNDDAQYYLAMTYFKRDQYLLGAYEFSKLIRNIPASPFVAESQYMLAECYYQLAPAYQLDQSYTKKAIEEFQAFIDFFPADKKVEVAAGKIKELTERLAEKEYQAALIYEKMEYEKAAIKYYANVSEIYHDTKFAPQALYRKIQLELKKGMNSEALSDISVFLSRYPDNSNSTELQETETKLGQKK
ncbi:MAG: outer membrane protein assembly factor BamD [Melioribacteraceae bacterium]